jgi:uncharacterized protein (TIGR04255 family)
MSSTKLKNAPLKEVIFELHWECNNDNTGMPVDAGFDLAQGKFAEKLKPEFPLHRKLIPEGAPVKFFGAPMHQYWKGEFQWPVIQHGQGMIAVNETEQTYDWEERFSPLIKSTIEKLVSSYDEPLLLNMAKLQYVDAWEMDGVDPADFMKENLQTQIVTDFSFPGQLRGFNVQQSFNLDDSSVLQLNIFSGINNQNQKESVIWTTTIEKSTLLTTEEISVWIESAHGQISTMFKKMLKPEFYASLIG